MKLVSPLRYPGGKAKIVDFVKQVIRDNNLLDGVYVEPYAGGAAVALSLLMDEYVSRIIINDKDRSIYAFWHSVLYETDSLCSLIEETPVTMDTWKIQREIQSLSNKQTADLLHLGFSTFFMNRTNRSGIIKAGVIGGFDQTGNYKIDARYKKEELIARIRRISSYSDRIKLYNSDAVDLVKLIQQEVPQNSILYLDPPYYKKGRGLYMNYYDDADHEKIRDAISCVDSLRWMVSYDNSPFIQELYKSYRSQQFYLNYSANNNGKGTEVIFFSDNCKVSDEALSKLKIVDSSL
jgi:DNA adenine methylase